MVGIFQHFLGSPHSWRVFPSMDDLGGYPYDILWLRKPPYLWSFMYRILYRYHRNTLRSFRFCQFLGPSDSWSFRAGPLVRAVAALSKQCSPCWSSWTETLSGGVWNFDNFYETMTISMKHLQLLWSDDNFYETMRTSVKWWTLLWNVFF